MKYGMRERISGGIILVAIAVILVLFFFGRPGHRDEGASAPDVSFNQQPVTSESQGIDPQPTPPAVQPSGAPDLSQVNGGGASAVPQDNAGSLDPLPEPSAQERQVSTTSSGNVLQPTNVVPVQSQPSGLATEQQRLTQTSQTPQSYTAPTQEAPKREAPKREAPKREAPKREAPKLASNDPIMSAAATRAEAPKREAPASTPADGWSVQAGSFGNNDNAQRLIQRLSQSGFKAYTLKRDPNTVVLVGPFSTSQAAEEVRTQMQQRAGTNGLVVRNGKH